MTITHFIVYLAVAVSAIYIIYYVLNILRKGEAGAKCSRCIKMILKNSDPDKKAPRI